MVTDHCRYGNHATHQIHFHSQQNESSCIFSPCPPRSLQYDRGYCPFLAFFHSTRLRLLNFVNKTFWWSRFSFWTSRHLEFWPHRASAVMPPSCKSHQYQMSHFVGNDFHMPHESQSLFTSLVAYPGFRSMKRPGVFLLPTGWDASPLQGYPQQ